VTKFETYWKKVDAKKRKSFEHGQALWAQIAKEKAEAKHQDSAAPRKPSTAKKAVTFIEII